ncbi:hypothetical protein ACI1TU_02300 [Lactococcus garvieae]|uniref:hypothetical protein n=1 Tax=Lactococcus garvieae TaxID=1363 RepID=UPI0038542F54
MAKNNFFQIDGQPIDNKIIEEFNLREYSRNLRFSRSLNSEVLDFVGFVINDNSTLISLPKHYVSKLDQDTLGEADINLLFQVWITDQIRNADNYTGPVKDFKTTFPFKAFYSIQQYYHQYGIYKETQTIAKPNYSGKISWKDTMRKAANIISSNNLVFLPLFSKETQDKQVFLSECMAFAISYTLKRFPYFVKGQFPKGQFQNFDFWSNHDYVVGRLKRIYSEVFKDIHKKLVKDLIEFYSNIPEGGEIIIKHYNFELVWEAIVEKYLNDNFSNTDSDRGLVFGENKAIEFKKERFYVDKNSSKNRIEPDHYYQGDTEQYIFDAKYYTQVSTLNYKQVAYQSFLKKNQIVTSNALILPTDKDDKSKVHFELKRDFFSREEDAVKIWEYYLNMKIAMENFIN